MRLLGIVILLCVFPLSVDAQHRSETEQLASEYYKKGINYRTSQKDSSYYYLDRASELSYEIENYSDAIEIALEAMVTSSAYYDLESYRFYLGKIERILQEEAVESAFSPENLEYYKNRLIYNEANYLYKLKDYDGARSKAIQLREKFTKKDIAVLEVSELTFMVYSTHLLAVIAMNTGKYDLAENYFNQALGYSEKNDVGKKRGLDRGTKRLFSQLYILMGKHKRADAFLSELLIKYKALYTDDKEYKNSLVTVYQRMVNNLVKQDSLQKALFYLDESREFLLDDDPFYKESLLLYGDIYAKLGQDQNALEHYRNALDFFEEYRRFRPHQDIAGVEAKIAGLHLENGDFSEGLTRLKKAFNTAGNNIHITAFDQNPEPDEVFSKTQLLQLLDIKLQLLQKSYEQTADTTLQKAALATSTALLNTFDKLKSEFDSKLDKQFLAEKAYPIFHRMLETAYSAYKNNGSSESLQLALNIAEKNKDFVLLEALRSAQATQYGNVPQDVLDREAQLRAEITHVEKQIFDEPESDSGFSDALFQLKQDYYRLLDTIKIKYPKYHDLKYRTESLDLAIIRDKLLRDNGTLLSYSITDDYLYTIILNGSKENFLKLPFSETDREDIRDFYNLLSTPSINSTEIDIDELSKRLYQKTLKEPLKGFDSENLTIIPDGELHYLPFDMLQKEGSYLVRSKNIGYGNSVASLLELKEKKSGEKNKVLAFAPSFTGVEVASLDRQFGKLLYNDDEVSKIGAFYDTETVLDDQATFENFKAKTPDFNMLHLATHASANDEYPDYSYLAFTEAKDSTDGNILYIKDLYNTSLNADMVTLSACQTGIGKLQKGQGMLSLSKGFYYAGAKSLVNTLWKINDKSTVRLMEYFYEGLSQGKSKTQALRDAKLKYLETTDDHLLRQPYYWAAFVVSGDVSPITKTHYWWYIGAGMLFFLVLFFISRRKGKIKEFRRVVLRTS